MRYTKTQNSTIGYLAILMAAGAVVSFLFHNDLAMIPIMFGYGTQRRIGLGNTLSSSSITNNTIIQQSNITPQIFTTVSPVNGVLANNGANFGPATNTNGLNVSTSPFKGSTKSTGIIEGITSVVNSLNTSTVINSGTLFLIPNGVFTSTVQISIPDSINIESAMGGGEAYGPILIAPASYVIYTGSSSVQDAIICSNIGDTTLTGVSFVSSVAGLRSVFRSTGSRGLLFDDSFFQSTVQGTASFLMDGALNPPTGINDEDNLMIGCFFTGDSAIQLGITGENQKPNNQTWINPTAEGLWIPSAGNFQVQTNSQVLLGIDGGNQVIISWYSRGDTTTNSGAFQFKVVNAEIKLMGGELNSGSSSAGGMLTMGSGGRFIARDMSWTAGSVTQTNGTLLLFNVRTSGAVTHTLSGGYFQWDSACNLSNWTLNASGSATIVGPRSSGLTTGSGPWGLAAYNPVGGSLTVIPGALTTTLLTTNPPTSGTTYQNTTGFSCQVKFVVTTGGTVTVVIGPTPTPLQTVISAQTYAIGAEVNFEVPNGYYFKITLVTTVIAAGTAIGYN